MKEGAYYEMLSGQLLEDYMYLKQWDGHPKFEEIATHVAKAQIAITNLSERVKSLERRVI